MYVQWGGVEPPPSAYATVHNDKVYSTKREQLDICMLNTLIGIPSSTES